MRPGLPALASRSPLLQAKRAVLYFEIPCRTILNRCSHPNMPFAWTINPYRGCEFACKYCYARHTHEFLGMEDGRDFEEKIYAKARVGELLRGDLKKAALDEPVAIGTATDPYQPAERRFGRTRAVMEVFAREKGRQVSITTKSDLVTRDVELLQEVARRNILHINITVTTMDEDLARQLEPLAPRPALRVAAIERLARAGLSVGVFPNPILPLLTDSEESLERVAAAVAAAGAGWMGGGLLYLRPAAKGFFFPFLAERFPHLLPQYQRRFRNHAFQRGPYEQAIRERLARIRARHGLAAGPLDYRPEEWEGEEQLPLFPLE
ncbi:MAG: radical SAM protein [Bryobacterales bacterium]|nr:radical SAM protein [Bryobacterales bacterium]